MVVSIVYDLQVAGKWFLRSQEYLFVREYYGMNDCATCTSIIYDGNTWRMECQRWYVVITTDGVEYHLPEELCALLNKDEPGTDMRGQLQKWIDRRTKDIVAPLTGGHTDVVKQAKMFLNIDIAKRKRNVEVDQQRLQMLRYEQERRGYPESNGSDEPDEG